jgi:hypothetical protein
MISILRDLQVALDPTGVGLGASWGALHMQPCPPWVSNNNAYPSQNASLPGMGRAWLGVTCSEWGGTTPATSTVLGGAETLVIKRLGMVGILTAPICELFPSLTFLDVSQNALRGSLPPCLGTQPTAIAGRMELSVFDNLFEGTVPASYAALDWVALSYNPYLIGALPANLPIGSLYAWSAYQNKCVPTGALRMRRAEHPDFVCATFRLSVHTQLLSEKLRRHLRVRARWTLPRLPRPRTHAV